MAERTEMIVQKDDLAKTLRRIPWFLDLEDTNLDQLALLATIQTYEPGEILFKEGDPEDFLFILLEGQVVLEIEVPTHGQLSFYTAETLDIIGWSSMTPIVRQRTASARATQRSMLLCFQSKLLQQLCDENHDLGYVIMRRLANVVANRLLTSRVHMMELIAQMAHQETGLI
jgi:CRP/FNR family transcriptional regulator, cyclic AMP receptor protein